MVPEIRELPHQDRLRILDLHSLDCMSRRGDVIVHQIIHGLIRIDADILQLDYLALHVKHQGDSL